MLIFIIRMHLKINGQLIDNEMDLYRMDEGLTLHFYNNY